MLELNYLESYIRQAEKRSIPLYSFNVYVIAFMILSIFLDCFSHTVRFYVYIWENVRDVTSSIAYVRFHQNVMAIFFINASEISII